MSQRSAPARGWHRASLGEWMAQGMREVGCLNQYIYPSCFLAQTRSLGAGGARWCGAQKLGLDWSKGKNVYSPDTLAHPQTPTPVAYRRLGLYLLFQEGSTQCQWENPTHWLLAFQGQLCGTSWAREQWSRCAG